LLALLLAERDALRALRDTSPVMLLDDVLSELDPERRARLLDTLADGGQTLLSTADARTVPDGIAAAHIEVHPPPAADQDQAMGETA
jgi:DNA replication and repair protein RecF